MSWTTHADCPCLYLEDSRDVAGAEILAMYHHDPVGSDAQAPASAGLWRNPAQLTISAFDYDARIRRRAIGSHSQALPAGRRCAWPQHERCSPAELRLEHLSAFARHPEFRHGSLKMLTGARRNDAHFNATDERLAAALRRLGSMLFVGLTECYNESTWLFRERVVSPDEPFVPPPYQVYRPAGARGGREAVGERASLARLHLDPPESTLYWTAAARFFRELRASGGAVQTHACREAERGLMRWRLGRRGNLRTSAQRAG
jgi:hypothetical protein